LQEREGTVFVSGCPLAGSAAPPSGGASTWTGHVPHRLPPAARDTAQAMSRADIETLRVAYEAVSRGDWDAATRDAHPELELQTSDRVVSPGTYRGVKEVRRFFEDMFEPFEEVVVEPEEFFERGDQIAVFVVTRLTPAGSSGVLENRTGHLWTMREGKASRLEVFPRREAALEAAGLRGGRRPL
jgi:ketosteroid isomerase-like protein